MIYIREEKTGCFTTDLKLPPCKEILTINNINNSIDILQTLYRLKQINSIDIKKTVSRVF